jgi:hypothetical protein
MGLENKAQIARVCHEAVRAYARAMGDFSYDPWDLAAKWRHAVTLNAVTYAIVHDHPGPEAVHGNWVRFMEEQGWSFGVARDDGRKKHYLMRAYEVLPTHHQAKFHIFCAIVHAMCRP